jgi:hypothetical protein
MQNPGVCFSETSEPQWRGGGIAPYRVTLRKPLSKG